MQGGAGAHALIRGTEIRSEPSSVVVRGGDCSDISYGNLIIKLSLPKQFDWNQNIIVYKL